ncbi:MAG TPA: hypothetical protein VD995_09335 [Azospirillum sp.]|nr:hypothetical protein [Azospirillum sp.]
MRHLTVAVMLSTMLFAPITQADEVAALGNPLRYIASAVDGAVRYDPGAADLTGMPLIEYATKNDTTLLAPFRDSARYTLDARRDGRHSAVLLCAGDTALYEDAGCTGPMDWNGVAEPRPCGFALDLPQVCARPAKH